MLFLFAMYPVYFFESTPSTNILAKKLAEKGAMHGSAVIAANQTEGRGRLGKSWFSAGGKGLFCSIIVRPRIAAEDFPKITLAAGLAVAQAIDRLFGGFTQLKWPNDIFLDGKKCGGILTESSTMPEPSAERFAVIGIGMNLCSSIEDFPEELQSKATSLFLVTGICPDVFQFFTQVRDELLQMLDLFYEDGFPPILTAWKRRDFLLGKEMECVGFDGNIIAGVSLGPDAEGQLHIKDVYGEIHTVLTGDIRLAGREIKNG